MLNSRLLSNERSLEEDEQRINFLLDTILDIDERILSLGEFDPHDLYDLLFEAALKLGKTDAFYVCLYEQEHETVFFPYNREGEHWDISEIKLLGNGPTSWVIRNGMTYMMDDSNANIQHGGENFGDLTRQSRSAIHTPISATGLDNTERLWGVLSMQSYEPYAYDYYTKRAFEWLAKQAGMALQRKEDNIKYQQLLDISGSKVDEQHQFLRKQANDFTKTLQMITRQVEAIQSLINTVKRKPELHSAFAELYDACKRGQSEAVQNLYLLMNSQSTHTSEEIYGLIDPYRELTDQQRKILVRVTQSLTNREIADQLNIAPSTVKTHLDNIFKKLGVSGRLELAQLATPFTHLYKESPK